MSDLDYLLFDPERAEETRELLGDEAFERLKSDQALSFHIRSLLRKNSEEKDQEWRAYMRSKQERERADWREDLERLQRANRNLSRQLFVVCIVCGLACGRLLQSWGYL